MTSILPPNATETELAIEAAVDTEVPVPIRAVICPDGCLPELLPWLAWTFSVDVWDPDWPESTKRAVIAASISVHRQKGTLASIRAALDAAGYPEARIVETWGTLYDGSINYDGSATYASPDHWAQYRIELPRPITIAQAGAVRAILAAVAPARCELVGLFFEEAAHLYDGSIRYDGTHSYGVA